MPLLNRGAIANFFGLADEEEYEYQDYPETTKKAVQPTKKKYNTESINSFCICCEYS